MASNDIEAAALPPVLFGRPGKKRKAYRQRPGPEAGEEDAERTDQHSTGTQPEPTLPRLTGAGTSGDDGIDGDDPGGGANKGDPGDDNDDNDSDNDADEDDHVGIAVAELIRQQKAKARRQKLGGVEFRAGDGARASSSLERGLVLRRPDELEPGGGNGDMDMDDDDDDDNDSAEPLAMGLRFAPQTGIIGEAVNKHMEEYVEAQMAKRYKAEALLRSAQQQQQQQQRQHQQQTNRSGHPADDANSKDASRQQLAMKGKLHEVDLGTEARARNIARTEQATRGLHGPEAVAAAAMAVELAAAATTNGNKGAPVPESAKDSEQAGSGGSRRSGRDGGPSDRKRRRGDDIKRDQLVEAFLRENPMDVDVYDVAREAAVPTVDGKPADDKIAEQFRREFMESMAQRMRRKRRPLGPAAKPKTRNEEEILRGPKLGGSRNVRSVMRDKLLQKQEEQRQSMPKYEQQLQEERRRANRRR